APDHRRPLWGGGARRGVRRAVAPLRRGTSPTSSRSTRRRSDGRPLPLPRSRRSSQRQSPCWRRLCEQPRRVSPSSPTPSLGGCPEQPSNRHHESAVASSDLPRYRLLMPVGPPLSPPQR